MPGIAGLCAGASWVRRQGTERILQHERRLARRLRKRLEGIGGVEVICPDNEDDCTGVLSFRVQGQDCESLNQTLGQRGFALRSGLHCAPQAHRLAGTLETGTLRASVSAFNTQDEIDCFAAVLSSLLQN
jgi:selenocysteine lyase/cysteine desulfurase